MRVKGDGEEPVTLGAGGSCSDSQLESFPPFSSPEGSQEQHSAGRGRGPECIYATLTLKGFSTLAWSSSQRASPVGANVSLGMPFLLPGVPTAPYWPPKEHPFITRLKGRPEGPTFSRFY